MNHIPGSPYIILVGANVLRVGSTVGRADVVGDTVGAEGRAEGRLVSRFLGFKVGADDGMTVHTVRQTVRIILLELSVTYMRSFL